MRDLTLEKERLEELLKTRIDWYDGAYAKEIAEFILDNYDIIPKKTAFQELDDVVNLDQSIKVYRQKISGTRYLLKRTRKEGYEAQQS